MINEADFSALGLSEEMLAAVQAKGFETPTSIQRLTIPRLLSGENDIIAQSQTGTGKTAAFGLPILQQIEPSKEGVQSIILVPTRELAVQAAEELLSYNRERRLSITAIYGGAAMSEQLRRLSRGVDIVVGTPGRVLDHIRRGTLKLDKVRFLVLDEADEMLNMGSWRMSRRSWAIRAKTAACCSFRPRCPSGSSVFRRLTCAIRRCCAWSRST